MCVRRVSEFPYISPLEQLSLGGRLTAREASRPERTAECLIIILCRVTGKHMSITLT